MMYAKKESFHLAQLEIEICANSYSSALAAENGGAIRVELCDNMAEGGTTPSYGQIKLCIENLNIEIWPIIRPRGGDFLYSDDEFEVMKADIMLCKELNCHGVVTGILTASGEVDMKRCADLIAIAKPMPIAFHRAFDRCINLEKALANLIELGFVRVLTSGGAENAYAGIDNLALLIKLAKSNIEIMPGAGINAENISEIKEKTGATIFHSSARIQLKSKMETNNHFYKTENESRFEQTSIAMVKNMVEKIK